MRIDRVTASGRPPVDGPQSPAPDMSNLPDGQHRDHWVLSAEERAKGFVRPMRRSYIHVGVRPVYELRPLTEEETNRYAAECYVAYEKYPDESSVTGRFWTQAQLNSGCGSSTRMPVVIAETYAREPGFYGSTFCARCGTYFRVGEHGEFVWDGTDERVGT